MHDHDHPAPSPEEPRPTRRPPYGLPLRKRPRLLTASDSLTWRRYSTPTPPKRSLLRKRLHSARPALIAGFLACVGFGIWSGGWPTDSASPRTNVASMPTPRQSVAERSAVVTSPPASTPAPRMLSSATPRSRPKVPKSKATSSGSLRRSPVSAVPRKRHQHVPAPPPRKTTIPVDRVVRKTRRVEPKDSESKPPVPPLAAKCDELFPPSLPEFQMRNQACHELMG